MKTQAPRTATREATPIPLRDGAPLRARYKGRIIRALVRGGRVIVRHKSFPSPSAAAAALLGRPVNGWTFWEFARPRRGRRPAKGSKRQPIEWQKIDALRA